MNGVAALFGFIIIYDSWAMAKRRKTITTEYREAFQSHPVITVLGTGYVLAHLHDWPRQFKYVDAFDRYALLFGYLGQRMLHRTEEALNDAMDRRR